MVAAVGGGCYALINLSSGTHWATPTIPLENVFGHSASDFRSVESVTLTYKL